MLIAGVDEAGRGPALGSLVICGVSIELNDLPKLLEIGVKDSKELSRSQRIFLYPKILKIIKNYSIKIISPQEIDKAINSETSNLNWLEADNIADIFNELKPEQAIVDCPSPNKTAFKNYIDKRLTTNCEIICHHKADRNYLEVAAASVLAKVTRDNLIEDLKKEINIDFGSGYPSDPKTKKFLIKYGKTYPNLCRTSWASYKNLFPLTE